MAITKERLQELIKQGATIWEYNYEPFIAGYSSIIHINPLQLDTNCYIEDDKLYTQRAEERSDFDIFEAELKDIFETRKQAEWYLKYHATRTEELDLPTWEEPKADQITTFMCKDHREARLYVSKFYNCVCIEIGDWTEFREEYSEENYIKACDLCVKLFKGEEE